MVALADGLALFCREAVWTADGADVHEGEAAAFAYHRAAVFRGSGCAVATVAVRVAWYMRTA